MDLLPAPAPGLRVGPVIESALTHLVLLSEWYGRRTRSARVDIAIPVLWTKLTPPTHPGGAIVRPRLVTALADATRLPLTLLRAGAGYGKTTLLATPGALRAPFVWYSLGSSDTDLAVFVSHLVAGIRRHDEGFGEGVLTATQAAPATSSAQSPAHAPGPSPRALADRFAADLAASRLTDLTIVLDDYHFVDRSRSVRAFVNALLTRLPPCAHLVISTRRSPGLSAAPKLMVTGLGREIGEDDLRFTLDEARELLTPDAGGALEEEAIAALAEQMEGWVMGLRLASHSAAGVSSRGQLDRNPGHRRLFDYLVEEVLNRQRPAVRRFLVESCILPVLTPAVCDTVLDRSDSAVMLETAERESLFVTQVGDDTWRYHHLFGDFLRHELERNPARAAELHRRAAAHFETEGDVVQAVEHRLAAHDFSAAAALLQRHGHRLVAASRFDTVSRWLSRLPVDTLAASPDLLHLQAEILSLQGHYDQALPWLERAAQAYAATGDALGLVRVVRDRAFHAIWRLGRHGEGVDLCRRGLALLGPENRLERAELLRSIALSSLVTAQPAAARAAYEEALAILDELGDTERTLSLLVNPGTWLSWIQSRYAEGLRSLERAQEIAERLGSTHALAECLGGQAIHLVNLGRWQEARVKAQEALRLSRAVGAVNLEAYNLSFLGNAYASGPEPELALARGVLDESAALALGERNERIRIGTEWVRIGVLRRLGEVERARQVGEEALAAASETTDQWLIAAVELNLGAVLAKLDPGRARVLLESARGRFSTLGTALEVARADMWLAALLRETDVTTALDHLCTCIESVGQHDFAFLLSDEPETSAPLLVFGLCHGTCPQACARALHDMGPRALVHLAPAMAVVTPPDAAPPPLRIRCFGNFRVTVGDRIVRDTEWSRRKPKRLLELVSSSPECTVTWDRVADNLWPGLRIKEAHAGISRALYEVRRLLGPGYVASAHDTIQLVPDSVGFVDVHAFADHISAARQAERQLDHVRAEQEYLAAVSLYTGDFLENDLYEEWTMAPRDALAGEHALALERLGLRRMDLEDYDGARPYLERLLVIDATREDIHAALITCLSRLGRRSQALAQYEACADALKRELALEPGPDLQRLHALLTAEENL